VLRVQLQEVAQGLVKIGQAVGAGQPQTLAWH
jgi:hypothetical protein